MDKISRPGLVLALLYGALVSYIFSAAKGCLGEFCGTGIVVVMIPWSIIFEDGIQTSFFALQGMSWLWTAVLVNTIIAYVVGSFISKKFFGK